MRVQTNIGSFGVEQIEVTMRIVLNIVAVLLMLVGIGWFLQGINVLPGSFMSGQTQWAIYGGIALLAGIGLLVFANRRKGASPGK